MSNEEPKKREKLGLITGIIGSLAIILVAMISAHSIFPRILFYSIIIVFSGAILCLLIYQFIYPPIWGIIRNVKFSRKKNVLVSKYSKEFRNFVKDFYDCARSDKSHSLRELIYRIIDLQREKNWTIYCPEKIDPNDASPQALRSMLSNLVSNVNLWMNTAHQLLGHNKNLSFIDNPLSRLIVNDSKSYNDRKTRFVLEVDYFQYILSMYESMIKDFTDVCRTIKQTDLLEGVRKEYLSFASDLDYFFKKYSDFGKEANKEFGETIFRTYFEIPKVI
jgi:hypothetical protein